MIELERMHLMQNIRFAQKKFKSVNRAIRRGHIDSLTGEILTGRKINNRKSTKGRCKYREATGLKLIYSKDGWRWTK